MDEESDEEIGNNMIEEAVSSNEAGNELLTPRDYQLEIFETVREKNSIIVLGTGSGKTFVSILLIKDLGHQIRGKLSEGSKRSFFIVNSVPLAYQQQKAIQNQTAFKVGIYEGSMGVDFWSEERWKKELEDNEVIVILAQIFLNIILHRLIAFCDINLIIMDECHHAQGSHPMREIMREYCNFKLHRPNVLPRICGMTASVINCKVSSFKVPDKMKELETVLDSSLITSHYQASVNKYMTNAKEMGIVYDTKAKSILSDRIIALIDEMIVAAIKDVKCSLSLDENHTHKAKKFIKRLGMCLNDMLDELGEYCLCQAVILETETLETAESDNPAMKKVYDRVSVHLGKLKTSLEVISCLFSNIMNHVTPKVIRLVDLLRKGEGNRDLYSLVFVQRRNTAKLLYFLLTKLSQKQECSFLKVGVVVGGLTSIKREDIRMREVAKQDKIIQEFRDGALNVIVSTSVLEEGIDVRNCNMVVRFNVPQNFRSYVQSLGRARAMPSTFVMFVHQNKQAELYADIQCYKAIHRLLTSSCFNRQLPTLSEIADDFAKDCGIPPFQPFGPLGAKITGLSAVALLNLFCGRLPKDRFTNLTVGVQRKQIKDVFYVGLTLPINAPFRQTIWSSPRENYDIAKKDAALCLCKELYIRKKLDSNLLPISHLRVNEKDPLGIYDQLSVTQREVGTRKNRQLYRRLLCSAFSTRGTLFLHSIAFRHVDKFRPDINFGGDFNIGIICSQMIPSTIFHLEHTKWGKLEITPKFLKQIGAYEDLGAIQSFHQSVLTQLLGISETVFEYQPLNGTHNIFLVALDKNCDIDYNLMLKANESMVLNEEDKAKLLRNPTDLHDKIVKPPAFSHQSSDIYFVKEVRSDYTPQSTYLKTKKSGKSYVDYYKSEFGVQIVNVTQPLINCSHMPTNLNCLSACKYRPAQNHILLLVPELCDVYVLPASLFWKIFCIPSILHRINELQLEMEMIREINYQIRYDSICPLDYSWVNVTIEGLLSSTSDNICAKLVHRDAAVVPTGAILQAITPISAMDQFNLERLEVLGDSYLKFRTSKYLFMKEATEDEGVLTSYRSNLISNKTLFILAKRKNLGNYIQGIHLMHPAFPFPHGFCVKPEVESVLIRTSVNPTEWNKFGQDNLAADCKEPYNPYSHQLLADKSISDTVEALIGSMLLCGGEKYATYVMEWFGFKFLNEAEEFSTHHLGHEFSVEELNEFEMMYSKNCLDRLESHIGYRFRDKRLLMEACTHPSYSYNTLTGCYQRLEFLGDAVLDYLITGYIYARNRDANPGKLTDWRSYYVNNETLARIAVQHRFYVYLLHLSSPLEKVINMFMDLVNRGETEFNSENDQVQVEEVEVPKALGDLIESIIGAVCVDSGFNLDTTWNLVRLLFKGTFDTVHEVPINCVRQLYEHDSSVKFEFESVNGKAQITARVKGLEPIKVTGKNKRVAKRAAAKKALSLISIYGLTS